VVGGGQAGLGIAYWLRRATGVRVLVVDATHVGQSWLERWEGRQVRLAHGSSLTVSSVLWCTGYRPDMSWIQIAGATDNAGKPLHHHGASPVPGLHWMGAALADAAELLHHSTVTRAVLRRGDAGDAAGVVRRPRNCSRTSRGRCAQPAW